MTTSNISLSKEAAQLFASRKAEIVKRVKAGQTQDSIQIGGESYTKSEWDKMLQKVDHNIEKIKEGDRENEAAKQKKEEKEQQLTLQERYADLTGKGRVQAEEGSQV